MAVKMSKLTIRGYKEISDYRNDIKYQFKINIPSFRSMDLNPIIYSYNDSYHFNYEFLSSYQADGFINFLRNNFHDIHYFISTLNYLFTAPASANKVNQTYFGFIGPAYTNQIYQSLLTFDSLAQEELSNRSYQAFSDLLAAAKFASSGILEICYQR